MVKRERREGGEAGGVMESVRGGRMTEGERLAEGERLEE